jgi:phosphoribosylformylglycinamidine cyclo-ligase
MDYKDAGVDVEAGDQVSKKAYANAKSTFSSRTGMIGEPVKLEGGFSGALDFGDFYLIQNDDGTGTKMEIAERLQDFSTIGADLVAMVADDAICMGAEVVSITNTFDVPSIDAEAVASATAGLAKACREQKIVIPGGEIAEVPAAVNRMVWNATAVGVVKKSRFLTGKNIQAGQKIIGLRDPVLRSNGMSLARKILEENFGKNWHKSEWKNSKTWGEILLTPSKIFHRLILDEVLGDFSAKSRPFNVTGICHITGGGIPGNIPRILPDGLGADFDNLHVPHEVVKGLQKLGNLEEAECYRTWHCGTALMIVAGEKEAGKICEKLNAKDNAVMAQIVGTVNDSGEITVRSGFSGTVLTF